VTHTISFKHYDNEQASRNTQGKPLSTNFVVKFEVFTAVTMKNGDFSDVTPCGSCKNRRFGGTWHFLAACVGY
jgi:hypothetical protein